MSDLLNGDGGDQEREDGFKLFSQAAVLQGRALIELQRLIRLEQTERKQCDVDRRNEVAAIEDKCEQVVDQDSHSSAPLCCTSCIPSLFYRDISPRFFNFMRMLIKHSSRSSTIFFRKGRKDSTRRSEFGFWKHV